MKKLQKIQRDLQEVVSALEMAKLVNFDFIGDPGDLPKRTRVTLEKQNVKLAKYLNRLPWKFNFYIDTKPLINMPASGPSDFPREYMKWIKRDSKAINLIFGTQTQIYGALDMHEPSPWIIMHSMVHAMFEGGINVSNDMYDNFIDLIWSLYGLDLHKRRMSHDERNRRLREIERMTPKRREKMRDKLYEEDWMVVNADKYAKEAANVLFTFRAARKKALLNPGEGIIDFLTQTLVNGMKADMVDPIPKTINLGKKILKLKVSAKEAAKLRKGYLQYHENWLKKKIDDEFVGKYVFI